MNNMNATTTTNNNNNNTNNNNNNNGLAAGRDRTAERRPARAASMAALSFITIGSSNSIINVTICHYQYYHY